jgi:tripartite motif-containing protein 71
MQKIKGYRANVASIFLMTIVIPLVTTIGVAPRGAQATILAYSCEELEVACGVEILSSQQPFQSSSSDLLAVPKYIKSWGGFGTAPGQFQEPSSVEVSSAGDVYAAGHEDRIQVFTMDGQLKFTFGKRGSADGQFQHPHGLAMDRKGGDILYVGDQENHRIQVFNTNGSFLMKFANPGLQHIHDIGIDRNNGDIYAPDYELGHLQKLSSTGSLIWKKTGFPQAWGVSVDSEGFIYLAVTGSNSLVKLDPLNGNILKKVSGFNKITGVYLDGHDLVYAVDAINKNVKIYDTELNLKVIWNLSTIIGGLEIEPEDITISDDAKRIYLAEVNRHTIVYMEREYGE